MESAMNRTNETFLAVLKAALAGEKADPGRQIPPEEWQTLFHMAGEHNVLPLFYEAVYEAPSFREAGTALSAQLKSRVRQLVMLQTMRTDAFLALNGKFRAAGVTPLVVKGIVCRMLYPQPDHRPSGDEDVLIPADQLDACHRVMLEFGMHTTLEESALSEAYEIPYRKEGSPLYIELHKHLFPPESEAYGDLNRFFGGVFDRAVTEDIQGVPVSAMGYTDHLFYLICHAFKHFLHSGFGIRQVCDVILFANAYGSRIDWQRVLQNCRQIHGEKFAAAMFQIGSKYLVFDREKAAYPDAWRSIQVDEIPMLEDLLSAGVYGGANMSRRHSSNITLDAVAAQKKGKKARGAMVSSLFPPVGKLEGRYPYLRKHPYLLPVAWLDRLRKYAKETKQADNNNAAEAVRIGNQRVDLLRLYGILK